MRAPANKHRHFIGPLNDDKTGEPRDVKCALFLLACLFYFEMQQRLGL
jgi:hypothetical protein